MRVLWWRGRRHGDALRGRTPRHQHVDARDQSGFSLVETMVALGLVFTVLVGLLGSLNTGVRGLLTGRQRTGAVAVAKEVVEQARGAAYERLGHNLADDTTLATDTSLTGPSPNWKYQPQGVAAPEPLVGAVNPTYPAHQWSVTRDGATYTIRAYVTAVDVVTGDDHKRLTVAVAWSQTQYGSVVSNEVRLSSFVSRFGVSSGSEVGGAVDVDSGSVVVTGTLSGIALSRGEMFFPYVHGDGQGELVTEARGFAGSARSELVLTSGTASGCGTSGTTATCDGIKAETVVDNDAGTAFPLHDAKGPLSGTAGTLSAGTPLQLTLGSTTGVTSKGSAQSCTTCSPAVGDGDGLVYGDDVANGAASMGVPFVSGVVSGSLVSVGAPGSATATTDSDAVAADQRITATGRLTFPQVDLVTLGLTAADDDDGGLLAPVGFTAGVRVGAVDVTAQAQAGPTALAPSASGGAVQVTVYDTVLGVPAYRTVTITPGSGTSDAASVTFNVVDPVLGTTAAVTLDTTITAGTKSTSSQSSGGAITSASASLTNWFVVQTRLRVVQAGSTLADLTIELDYGRLVATAKYEAA